MSLPDLAVTDNVIAKISGRRPRRRSRQERARELRGRQNYLVKKIIAAMKKGARADDQAAIHQAVIVLLLVTDFCRLGKRIDAIEHRPIGSTLNV